MLKTGFTPTIAGVQSSCCIYMDKLTVVRDSVGLCAKIINLSQNKHLIEYNLTSKNLLPLATTVAATFLSGFRSGLLAGCYLSSLIASLPILYVDMSELDKFYIKQEIQYNVLHIRSLDYYVYVFKTHIYVHLINI